MIADASPSISAAGPSWRLALIRLWTHIELINRNNFAILLVHDLAILIVNERLSSIVLSLLTSVTGLNS